IYNTGNEHPLRRLVSTFLSPLASSYMFVVALLLAAAWLIRRRPPLFVWIPVASVLFAGLLWTHSRSSDAALVLGLLVLAFARREAWVPLTASAAVVLIASLVFVTAYTHIAPVTSFTPKELKQQE